MVIRPWKNIVWYVVYQEIDNERVLVDLIKFSQNIQSTSIEQFIATTGIGSYSHSTYEYYLNYNCDASCFEEFIEAIDSETMSKKDFTDSLEKLLFS